MLSRCCSSSNRAFKDYGGRGITVCEQWRTSFGAFLADMGERPEGLELDRIDNDRGYEPSNCRWTTRKVQQRNTRRTVMLTFEGVTRARGDWADMFGLSLWVLQYRLRAGWDLDRALRTPNRNGAVTAAVKPETLEH